MYKNLTDSQKKVLTYDEGCVVVKACPGSGKTYSVAARLSRLLKDNKFGIATLSFTNVASDEIMEKLKTDFNISSLNHPNFIGTIDSFINQFIFLPYGHLYMKCQNRPELVGEPYSNWSVYRFEGDYAKYFDKTSFDSNDVLIQLAHPKKFHFTWRYINKDGSTNGNIKKIIDIKHLYYKKGYATQSDANYISLQILKSYPLIAKNLISLFKFFVIDEAQDTNDVQMAILDILFSSGKTNIMLVGDRDQSIFEWNNAKPELFDEKFNKWDKIELKENWRSSRNICDFIKYFSSFDHIHSINKNIKNYPFIPKILGYTNTTDTLEIETERKKSINKIISHFFATCEENKIDINIKNVAILYRGTSTSKYLEIIKENSEFDNNPWVDKHTYVKDLIKGKYLYSNGNIQEGYKLMEKGIIEAFKKKQDIDFYCSKQFIQNQIDIKGFKNHRDTVFKFIKLLPETKGKTLNTWVSEASNNFKSNNYTLNFIINELNGNILIDNLFFTNNRNDINRNFYIGTVHSAKGKTFEAVLLLLGKKSGMNYVNMINKDFNELKPEYQEELRIVYVGISRPSKILILAVPREDCKIWKNKFNQK